MGHLLSAVFYRTPLPASSPPGSLRHRPQQQAGRNMLALPPRESAWCISKTIPALTFSSHQPFKQQKNNNERVFRGRWPPAGLCMRLTRCGIPAEPPTRSDSCDLEAKHVSGRFLLPPDCILLQLHLLPLSLPVLQVTRPSRNRDHLPADSTPVALT